MKTTESKTLRLRRLIRYFSERHMITEVSYYKTLLAAHLASKSR